MLASGGSNVYIYITKQKNVGEFDMKVWGSLLTFVARTHCEGVEVDGWNEMRQVHEIRKRKRSLWAARRARRGEKKYWVSIKIYILFRLVLMAGRGVHGYRSGCERKWTEMRRAKCICINCIDKAPQPVLTGQQRRRRRRQRYMAYDTYTHDGEEGRCFDIKISLTIQNV